MTERRTSFLLTLWRNPLTFPVLAVLQVVVLTLFVQFLFLPRLAPHLHAGAGLLEGHDGYYFHLVALALHERILAEGWGAWELRPRDLPVAGIAALLYTLLFPSPLVFLPLNALSWGLSTALIMRITRLATRSPRAARWAGLLFLLFPSQAIWYTQMHRELLFLPGLLLIAWSLLALARKRPPLVGAVSGGVLGILAIWVMRPYFLTILTLALLVTVLWLALGAYRAGQRPGRLMLASLPFFAVIAFLPIRPALIFDRYIEVDRTAEETGAHPGLPAEPAFLTRIGDKVQRQVLSIDHSRQHLLQQIGEAGTHIDEEVRFTTLGDVLVYCPRALQIGYLAPFPPDWVAPGHSPGGSLFRRLVGGEMMLAYLGLGGFLLLLVPGKGRWTALGLLGFATVIILLYALAVPNVGSLYRYRYPVWISLVLPGLAWLLVLGQIHWRRAPQSGQSLAQYAFLRAKKVIKRQ